MSRHVDVAIGILVEHREGRPWILIARRKADAVLGGYWELPGGKMEAGETPAQCLVREYEEELGVVVNVGEPLSIIEFAYDHALVRLHPFYCSRLSGEPRNLHVADHRWVPAAELTNYQFPAANTKLIESVRDTLMATH